MRLKALGDLNQGGLESPAATRGQTQLRLHYFSHL